ncbi:SPOR domain-containing protein [Ancylobacter sp. 6x-1]|uniref:SPOR domain-containing protein n=1 Tax=Ancylobacter crimeensis TaxID=2579147 RepID=A0ABT0DFW0_9HYPH|nr:SPOR domain-containing protein [Ancylobacter crimeensis]MCK0198855.1 SPOR domain-containing protein [Ancylobacter crimeensis]
MVDESRGRYRQDEAHPQSASERAAADERLAELARLIAQDDPFADLMASQPAARPAAPRAPEPRAQEPRAPMGGRQPLPQASRGPESRGQEPRGQETRGQDYRAPEPRPADPRQPPRNHEPRPRDPRLEPRQPDPRGQAPRGEAPRGQEPERHDPRMDAPRAPTDPRANLRIPAYGQGNRAPRDMPLGSPGPLSNYARDVYADPTRNAADPYPGQPHQHALENQARELNRNPSRPVSRQQDPFVDTRRPAVTERARDTSSAGAAAVADALGQGFDFDGMDAPVPPPRQPQGYGAARQPAGRPAAVPEARGTEPRASDAQLPDFLARDRSAQRPAAPAGRQPLAPVAPAQPAAPARPGPEADEDERLDLGAHDRGAAEDVYDDEADVDYTAEYEAFDAEQRARKRKRLVVVTALVLLGTVALTGFYVWRQGGGGSAHFASSADGQPPVIKADDTPNKVTPDKPTGDPNGDGQKVIYDRVGADAPQGGEKVVPREEQPVDVTQAAQPRNVTVGAPTPSTPAPTGAMPASGAAPAAAGAGATEPRRVRTLTVRADGTVVDAPAPAPVSPTTPVGGASPTDSTPIAYAPATPAGDDAGVPLPPNRDPAGGTQTAAVDAASGLSTASGFFVQLASVGSQAEAQGVWKSAQTKYPGVLGNYKPSIRRVDLADKGIYYRTQVGPFANRDQAVNLCQNLRTQGGQCMVQKY